jgi:UDP-glucose 4-epimerase
MTTSLVTGGTGFLGANVARALARAGHAVRVVSRGTTDPARALPEHAEVVQADLAACDLRALVRGVDILFHFASTTSPATAYADAAFDVQSNLVMTIGLLQAAADEGVRRVVFASSGGTVYGRLRSVPVAETHPTDPICSHGIVKLAIEKYLQLFRQQGGPDYTILRYANPYGPGQRMDRAQGAVAVMAGRILQGRPIDLFGDGSVVRDFIYIDDVVDATLRAADSEAARNEIFNIGSGSGVAIGDLVAAIERASGLRADVRRLPSRPFDVPVSTLDSTKAKTLLDWRASTPLDQGVAPTLAWLRRDDARTACLLPAMRGEGGEGG